MRQLHDQNTERCFHCVLCISTTGNIKGICQPDILSWLNFSLQKYYSSAQNRNYKVTCICEHEQGLERKHLGHTLHFQDCFCFLSYDSFSGKKWPFCESRGKGNCPAAWVNGLEEDSGQAPGEGGNSRTEQVSKQIAGHGRKQWARSYYWVASPTWTTEITRLVLLTSPNALKMDTSKRE